MAIIKHTGRRQNHSIVGDVILFSFLIILGIFMVLPFVYAISNALKPMEELFIFPPKIFVRNPTIDNFAMLLLRTNNMWVPLERYFLNSVFISVIATVVGVVIAAMAAYPIAKFKFPGRRLFDQIITLSLLFVYDVTAVPQYVILGSLKLLDSVWGVILPAIANTLGLYLMRQFITQIPNELIEAAEMDGASTWKQFWTIIIPNTKPAWITATILMFQGIWNRDTSSIIYTESLKNLPALFRQMTSTSTVATMGMGAAIAVVLMIPPILVFVFSQSRMVETMTYSGMKG